MKLYITLLFFTSMLCLHDKYPQATSFLTPKNHIENFIGTAKPLHNIPYSLFDIFVGAQIDLFPYRDNLNDSSFREFLEGTFYGNFSEDDIGHYLVHLKQISFERHFPQKYDIIKQTAYNNDVYFLCKNWYFDTNFVNYFLRRLEKYLSTVMINGNKPYFDLAQEAVLDESNGLYNPARKTFNTVTEFELLNLSVDFAENLYGSETNDLFSRIISNPVLSNVICQFISELLKEIDQLASDISKLPRITTSNLSANRCKSKNIHCNNKVTTLEVYKTLLNTLLMQIKQISDDQIRHNYEFLVNAASISSFAVAQVDISTQKTLWSSPTPKRSPILNYIVQISEASTDLHLIAKSMD